MAQLATADFFVSELFHDGLIGEADFSTIGSLLLINHLAYGCNLNQGTITDYRTFFSGIHAIPSTLYPNSYMAHNSHIGENELVLVMFGFRKEDLKTAITFNIPGPGAPLTFSMYYVPVQILQSVQGLNPVTNPQIYDYARVPQHVRMNYYAEATFPNNIFRHLFNAGSSFYTVGGTHRQSNDIYFVCDSASQIINSLSLSNNLPPNRHYHCMFSSSTFGDPSRTIHPYSKSIITRMNTPGIYKYTHIFNNPTNQNKGECNRFSLLPITVTHTGAGTTVPASLLGVGMTAKAAKAHQKTSVRVNKILVHANQKGTGVQFGLLDFPNSSQSTSKTEIIKKINKKANMYQKVWIAQGKRLGDHEQVAFADWIINNPTAINSGTTVHRTQMGLGNPMADGYVYPGVRPGTNTITLPRRSNVYYVTTDWPAFCFAVFNNISAILITSPVRGYIIAQFND